MRCSSLKFFRESRQEKKNSVPMYGYFFFCDVSGYVIGVCHFVPNCHQDAYWAVSASWAGFIGFKRAQVLAVEIFFNVKGIFTLIMTII